MLRNGVDLIEVQRVQDAIDRFGQRFLQRVYTPREIAEVGDAVPPPEWERRGADLAERILAAEAEARALLDEVPAECRQLITNHEAMGYFAERFDLEVIGTVIPGTSTAAEPSARDFAALAEAIRAAGVPAIFAESVQSTRLAESLAAEVGRDVAIVSLYTESLGEPGSGADSYPGMIVTDARLIADALADC